MEIPPCLTEDRHVGGHTDWLARAFTGEPCQHRLIDVPVWVMTERPLIEPVECREGEFGSGIRAPEPSLVVEELAQVTGHRTAEDGHRGTGSATARSRRSATRTYTEVEDGRR